MQGCFKSSLFALRTGSSPDRGPFYVGFFNYAIGLERLLKVIILLDQWQSSRTFPSNSELRHFGGRSGHDIKMLLAAAEGLFTRYAIERATDFERDAIDDSVLTFLADFAQSSRYFNLDTLAGTARNTDPLGAWDMLIDKVYETDVPELKRTSNEEQTDAFVEATKNHVVQIPSTSMSGRQQSYRELCQDHQRVALVLPEMTWRLVKILVPLKDLVTAMRERIHEEDQRRSADVSVPFMEDFLDFVCGDKNVILEGKDWP